MENVQQPINQTFDPARAVLYGQIIEAAYSMYENCPSNLTPTPSTLPAGYTFVAWVQMRDFTLSGPGPYTFYGLIAGNPSKPNEYVLAIRGTEGLTEWFDDLTSIVLVPLQRFGQVGDGFYTIYKTLRVVYPPQGDALGGESLEPAGSFANQVAAAIRRHSAQADEPAQLVVAGHSLGAALATIYVVENSLAPTATIPLICTFASPLVGDSTFASKFDQLGITSWRIVNAPDVVPMLPFSFLGFSHVQKEYLYNSLSSVVWSLACYHYLETYLHLLDPTQLLKKQCILPSRVAATRASRSLTEPAPAAAAPSASTQKEIALSVPHQGCTTINITIKI